MSGSFCEICGNEIPLATKVCPFCGCKQESEAEQSVKSAFASKVVNLEQGRPVVDVAVGRMELAIQEAKQQKTTVVTFIHGYGSSGKGGAIREECRKILDFMRSKKEIKDYIFGENFSRHNGLTRDKVRRYPELGFDKNLGKANRGITLVII